MRPPFFILGNPRSGTTLLRLMLASHPCLAVPPECGFAVWWLGKYGDWRADDAAGERRAEFLRDLAQSRKIETWELPWDALAAEIAERRPASYAALVALVYEAFARRQNPRSHRWGDKNNFHLRHVADLRRLFPDATLVHIVRDGRDVACSYRQVNRAAPASAYAPKLPDDVAAIAAEWQENLRAARASFDALGWRGVVEVRYEDLVAAPEIELRRVCVALGEEWDPAMLDYAERNRRDGLEPAEFLAWKALTLEPPRAEQAGRFRRDLSPADAARFAAVAGPTLALYRYA